MIDAATYADELRQARKIRLQTEAAGRYLEALLLRLGQRRTIWLGAFAEGEPAAA